MTDQQIIEQLKRERDEARAAYENETLSTLELAKENSRLERELARALASESKREAAGKADEKPDGQAENVKEHATLSAGASVERGVEVKTTLDHENRAADRGCCVSSCSDSSIPEFRKDELIVVREVGLYRLEIWAPGRPWAALFKLLNDNMGSILEIHMTPGTFPSKSVTNPEVLERNRKWHLQADGNPPSPSEVLPKLNRLRTRPSTNSPSPTKGDPRGSE